MASLESITRRGKQTCSDLRQLRESGKIPAIVYGYGTKSMSIKVDEIEFIKVIREIGRNGVIKLGVSSKTIKAMVTDYQFDPFKNQVTYTNFLVINMSEERTVEIPVRLAGEAVGTKEGDVVGQPLFNLEVTATPGNILEAVEVDITKLNINDSLAAADVKVTGDFRIENDSTGSVVMVVTPTEELIEEKIEAMEGEQRTEEPGVVGKNKEDEGRTKE